MKEAIAINFCKNLPCSNIKTNDVYCKRHLTVYMFNISVVYRCTCSTSALSIGVHVQHQRCLSCTCSTSALSIGVHVQHQRCLSVYMFNISVVYRCTCSTSALSIGVHVQHQRCLSVYMFNISVVYRCTCSTSALSIGVHVQHQRCLSVYMFNISVVYRCTCSTSVLSTGESYFYTYNETVAKKENDEHPLLVSHRMTYNRAGVQAPLTEHARRDRQPTLVDQLHLEENEFLLTDIAYEGNIECNIGIPTY
ncbi:hypothetical protein PR048_010919 [Dryococelus australis]|uniref:Uncharacterized protein n=1 Tax=Dryococelus australis TaxID=614101 RepID=A0ABQ9I414_9NEOP|nr:hypothetical protein PR048_010919 [Dryococelus australis]